STCTLTANKTGTYTVTITGTSGTLVHSATIDVLVLEPDFSLTASPNSVSFVVNNSATSTIALHSIGGFSGNVSLGSPAAPAGLTMFSPRSRGRGREPSRGGGSGSTRGSSAGTDVGTGASVVQPDCVPVDVPPPVVVPQLSVGAAHAAASLHPGES